MIPEMKLAAECLNDVSHGDFKSWYVSQRQIEILWPVTLRINTYQSRRKTCLKISTDEFRKNKKLEVIDFKYDWSRYVIRNLFNF